MDDIENGLFHELSLTGQQLYTLFHYSKLPTYREYMRQPISTLTSDGIRSAIHNDATDFVITICGYDDKEMSGFLTDVFMIRPEEARDEFLVCRQR